LTALSSLLIYYYEFSYRVKAAACLVKVARYEVVEEAERIPVDQFDSILTIVDVF
jgi:hypothetical protein